jgi:hypothetical protein
MSFVGRLSYAITTTTLMLLESQSFPQQLLMALSNGAVLAILRPFEQVFWRDTF